MRARVEPSKGFEFCRAGSMCHLHITIIKVAESTHNSLMYEVLTDQAMWAVCGRTAGNYTKIIISENIFMKIYFLILGAFPKGLSIKYVPP